ncbi:MAG: hypothetical protein KDA25_05135, partial [Phycisphaerales bacterium]|nr:hypothetical protein [Phycisphaerales bacterium]
MRCMRTQAGRRILAAGVVLALGLPLGAVADTPSAARIPADAPIVIHLADGAATTAAFMRAVDDLALADLPFVQTFLERPDVNAGRFGLLGLATAAKLTMPEAVGAVLGRDLTFAMLPPADGAAKPRFIAVATPADGAAVDRLLHQVHRAAGVLKNGEPDPRRTTLLSGVTVFRFGDDLLQARTDGALIVTNDRGLLASALDRRAAHLDADAGFARAIAERPDGAPLTMRVNLDALRELPPVRAAFEAPLRNIVASLLFGGTWRHMAGADSLTAWLTPTRDAMTVDARLHGAAALPEAFRGFATDEPVATRWHADALPQFGAEFRLSRDWGALFAERESIMSAADATQFVTFANTMSALLGRVDFIDDVMGRIAGPVHVVAARQDFEARGVRPTPRLPSFALVTTLDLDAGTDLARRLQSGATIALSVISYDAAINNRPALLLDVDRYRGHKFVSAAYPSDGAAAGGMMAEPMMMGTPLNFEPAIAIVDDALIVSSTRQLLEDLVDAMMDAKAEVADGTRQAADALSVDLRMLATILGDNRDEMIADRMVKEDEARETAAAFVDGILTGLARLDRLDVRTEATMSDVSGRVVVTFAGPKAMTP